MSKSKRTRGTTSRRRDADAAMASLEGPDEGVRTRSGAVVAPPETSHGRVSGRTPSPAPGASHPSPPATVETDEKRTWSPSSPGPAAEAAVAASPLATHAAPSSCGTTKRVDQRSLKNSRSPETDASPASAPASPTHQTLARDAPAFDGSSKTRTVRFSRHVHGFRFTKAERGLLVSVFDRFDGKTPSRGVCDAIARAFTRSPVRDPTRRALAREGPDDALAIKTRAAAPVAATPTFPKTPRVLLPGADIGDCPPHADPVDAGALSLARSPFRGAAWRDAAGARATFETHSRGAFEDGGAALGGRFQVCSGTEIAAPADSAEASRASDEPEVGLAFFAPATNAPEDVWADAVADAPEALAAAAASAGGDEDETRDGETLTRAQSAILSLPPAELEKLEGGSSLDALVGNASRELTRLERALDVSAWQTVGTSLYVGERAETATPPRARRASSPSPSPPPPDPAPGEPFLPETRGVLASEANGVTAAGGRRSTTTTRASSPSLFPRPDDAGEASDADAASRDRDREGDEARVVVVDRHPPVLGGEPSLSAGIAAPSPAYAPGVSLEALVREKDDDLAAALALGARTGRWVPLAAAGGEAQARTGNGPNKNDGAAAGTDAPSSAAQAAMVVSAAEELGDGEAHPVTWKQIKTWFENRRMTQKRIKEGNARPPRRNAGADADADAAKNANARGKPPRLSALKNRAAPDAGGSKDAFHSDPPPARRSLDETRRVDATARPGAKRARTDASAPRPAALRLPARRSLDLDRSTLDAAAAAAAAAEDLRARDAGWGEPPSALTREMSWADIHDALAGAERARAP